MNSISSVVLLFSFGLDSVGCVLVETRIPDPDTFPLSAHLEAFRDFGLLGEWELQVHVNYSQFTTISFERFLEYVWDWLLFGDSPPHCPPRATSFSRPRSSSAEIPPSSPMTTTGSTTRTQAIEITFVGISGPDG